MVQPRRRQHLLALGRQELVFRVPELVREQTDLVGPFMVFRKWSLGEVKLRILVLLVAQVGLLRLVDHFIAGSMFFRSPFDSFTGSLGLIGGEHKVL